MDISKFFSIRYFLKWSEKRSDFDQNKIDYGTLKGKKQYRNLFDPYSFKDSVPILTFFSFSILVLIKITIVSLNVLIKSTIINFDRNSMRWLFKKVHNQAISKWL